MGTFELSPIRAGQTRHLNSGVEERIWSFQEALASLRRLRGMLPICAWCKRVQDDEDEWHAVEQFVAAKAGVKLTHGICPHCLDRLQV